MQKDFEKVIAKAISNAKKDRDSAQEVLEEFMTYLRCEEFDWKGAGTVGAKYIESMQRSNEQLVKLAGILSKKTTDLEEEQNFEGGLSEEEFSELFTDIKKQQLKEK